MKHWTAKCPVCGAIIPSTAFEVGPFPCPSCSSFLELASAKWRIIDVPLSLAISAGLCWLVGLRGVQIIGIMLLLWFPTLMALGAIWGQFIPPNLRPFKAPRNPLEEYAAPITLDLGKSSSGTVQDLGPYEPKSQCPACGDHISNYEWGPRILCIHCGAQLKLAPWYMQTIKWGSLGLTIVFLRLLRMDGGTFFIFTIVGWITLLFVSNVLLAMIVPRPLRVAKLPEEPNSDAKPE